MDETGTVEYETIAEKLHSQKGYSVGVITSVNLNHATPAAFYAHQASRNSYYEIGLELIDSGFEYFAGGGLLSPTGSEGDQEDLYALAAEAGYKVVMTQAEAEKVTADDGKVIIIDEHLADSDAMAYENRPHRGDMWSLADYVAKGIEVLDNDEDGFFMMVRGRQDRLGLPRQRRRLHHPRHPRPGRRGRRRHRVRRRAPRRDPHRRHRRPRDRRPDHRLRRHRLRHLSHQPHQPEDLLRQVRQRLCRRLQGEQDLLRGGRLRTSKGPLRPQGFRQLHRQDGPDRLRDGTAPCRL